jgi:acetylornithine deacetylase/succinyl-diaminopimelate desuccinylase-like protein
MTEQNMDPTKARELVDKTWDGSVIQTLVDYIRIPNKSPLFDPDWRQHGYMDQAVTLIEEWCRAHAAEGMTLEVVRLDGRTPLIFMDIPGDSDRCVLLYGHLDKQPEMTGWRDGLGPWEPVIEGDKLYGRGGADDGYAAFASLTAIHTLKDQGIPHARCVVIIEACEESGSYDLPYYMQALADRIGTPDVVVCLDSGCGNYDQFWCTTSLRGSIGGELTVEVLTEGVHSGDASGIVPSSFRILRQLIGRIEDDATGEIKPREFHATIPAARIEEAAAAAAVLGDEVYSKFPFAASTQPIQHERSELVLNRTWRPALSVTGANGLPPLTDAGNVLRPMTAAKLSLRLPPTRDAVAASAKLKDILESEPPYDAKVTFEPEEGATGWNAPELAPWLSRAVDRASQTYFGRSAVYMGEGGSIPFMGMLGEQFPQAQFLITGVLGPHSNAHGPNEFLHIPTAKKITCCVAQVIADHFVQAKDR